MGLPGSPFLDAIAEHAPPTLSALPGADLPWLAAARREQLDAFLQTGLPSARNEAWKYTALRALQQHAYQCGDNAAATREVDARALGLPGVAGPRLVFVHGVFRADLSRLDDLPAGLTLQALSHALASDPEPLRFFLTGNRDKSPDAFARLNAALAGDGVVLRVAAGALIKPVVHIVHVGAAVEAAVAWHARSVIDIGAGASLRLVDHHVGSGVHKHLGTTVADVVVREGAHLDWLLLQDAAAGAALIRRNSVRLDANASAVLHALELGASLMRHDLAVDLRGDGGQLRTRGVFVPRARQHMDTHLSMRHQATNTTSDALWRGVADQRGRGVFHGAITVAPGADGADASLSNKNLLLSPHAEIDTQPVLEIYADEVKAAHGATVGQLDERSLFYLRSRGIPLAQARSLLTVAFCRAALDSVDNDELRAHLNTLLLDVHSQATGHGRQGTETEDRQQGTAKAALR